jgi:hypothetical protein
MIKWAGKNVDRINRMAYIESYKDQAWLLPLALGDLIPEDYVCYLVQVLVDAQD